MVQILFFIWLRATEFRPSSNYKILLPYHASENYNHIQCLIYIKFIKQTYNVHFDSWKLII